MVNFIPLRLYIGCEPVNESPRVESALLNQVMANLYSSPGPTCTRGDNMTVTKNLVMNVVIVKYKTCHGMFFNKTLNTKER